MPDRMPYPIWADLTEHMAVESWVIDAANMMIEAEVARRSAAALREQGDQRYLEIEHQMGNALIALQTLGYTLRAPTTEPGT